MRALCQSVLLIFAGAVAGGSLAAQEPSEPPDSAQVEPLPDEYSCTFCHADAEMFFGDTEHQLVTEDALLADIHWGSGLRCHDCHGGDPELAEFTEHRKDPGFRRIESPADIPGFCGHCHSDIEYMRQYQPSARTDQEAEYWTSGHGQRLKESMVQTEEAQEEGEQEAADQAGGAAEAPPVPEAPKVATCVDCHGKHGIRAVDDQQSAVYATRVAETCATCHADEKLWAGIEYRGRLLGHDQYDQWRESVHGRAMLENGDLSAPTCNDCHGNHGAVPPGVASVANACGTCHGKVSDLFAETRMRHKFEEVGLPGCATCHGSHQTLSPGDSDAMLGMESDAVCTECHGEGEGKYGATLAGTNAARAMRDGLESLKTKIAEAEAKIEQAERLGMLVSGPRFDLRQAGDALTNARSLIHSFSPEPVKEALGEGLQVAAEVKTRAEEALKEHAARRVWLAGSLVPILVVVVLLILYIRTLPPPAASLPADGSLAGPGETEVD